MPRSCFVSLFAVISRASDDKRSAVDLISLSDDDDVVLELF
jgi:hypothetical protein